MCSSSHPQPTTAGVTPVAIPRQQVSIERLPTRRQNIEPRESMNCKSCRKRKIKCNRMRPSCEACQVFQCPCVYDAVPKKRGPKTDVLEALLKRVDGLEAKLKDKNVDQDTSKSGELAVDKAEDEDADEIAEPATKRVATKTGRSSDENGLDTVVNAETTSRDNPYSGVDTYALLHTYFTRFHGKPYYILDEESVRKKVQLNQLQDPLACAIWAVASRHTPHLNGPQTAVKLSEDYALRSRRCLDTDEPCIENLQTLLLLVLAFTASGRGKKSFMLMSTAIGMATALELHREVDANAHVTPGERELRRRLFWTCYLLDRYLACGSKRSSLINDYCIALRLPSWCPSSSSLAVEGDFFQQGSNMQHYQGSGKKSQGNTGMLIDITRLLSLTNRYLAAGGVKADSHFPWHSLSRLSKIRHELDLWASGAGPVFSGLHALFRQPEPTIVFLSKLIYHLIHCLVYRPFLPIDLAELAGNGQHQSWQIEATNMCFLHANAICELIDAARQAGTVEWPAIVGYCICTAATVHIHGAHYTNTSAYGGDVHVFAASSDHLSRELQCLGDLHYAWANVQHQSDTLQGIYSAHGELVQAMPSNSMQHTPGFHLEDFFDRYLNIGGPGGNSYRFDPAHLSMSDILIDYATSQRTDSPHSTDTIGSSTEQRQGHKRKNVTSLSEQNRSQMNRPLARERNVSSTADPPPPPFHTTEQSFSVHLPQPIHHHQHPTQHQTQTQTKDESIQQQHISAAGQSDGHISIGASVDACNPPTTIPCYSASMTPASSTSNQGLINMNGVGTGNRPDTSFNSLFAYSPTSDIGSSTRHSEAHYDAVFASLPGLAFKSPSGWQAADDGTQHRILLSQNGMAPSPGNRSTTGSTGTGQSDEKDPFLSLLEQLVEDHGQRFNGAGTDLDFFLGLNSDSVV